MPDWLGPSVPLRASPTSDLCHSWRTSPSTPPTAAVPTVAAMMLGGKKMPSTTPPTASHLAPGAVDRARHRSASERNAPPCDAARLAPAASRADSRAHRTASASQGKAPKPGARMPPLGCATQHVSKRLRHASRPEQMRPATTIAAPESGDGHVEPTGFQLGGPPVFAPLVAAIDDRPDERAHRAQVVDVPVRSTAAPPVASQSSVQPARTEGAADVQIAAFIQRRLSSLPDCDANGPRVVQHEHVRSGRRSHVDPCSPADAGPRAVSRMSSMPFARVYPLYVDRVEHTARGTSSTR